MYAYQPQNTFLLMFLITAILVSFVAFLVWDIGFKYSDEKWVAVGESRYVWLLLSIFVVFPVGMLVYLFGPRQKLEKLANEEERENLLAEATLRARADLSKETEEEVVVSGK